MSRRILFWLGLVCLLLGLAPALSVMISSGIAEANDCILHEGFATPCVIGARDIGDLLGNMFVMGWFFLLTWPLAIGGGALLLLLALTALFRRLR